MQTIEEIRSENLRRLVDEGWTQASISRKMQRATTQVNGWFGKSAPRAISSASARELEVAVGKPRGWLDNRHVDRDQVVRLDPERILEAKAYARDSLAVEGITFDPDGHVEVFIAAYAHATEFTPESRDRLNAIVTEAAARTVGGSSGKSSSTASAGKRSSGRA